MNPAGIVIAIAGAWIVAQVFAGNALERLNILKPPAPSDGGILPPGIGGNITPNLPGGANNPPYVDFGKFFNNAGSGGGWL